LDDWQLFFDVNVEEIRLDFILFIRNNIEPFFLFYVVFFFCSFVAKAKSYTMKFKLFLVFSFLWFGLQAQETKFASTTYLYKGRFNFGISSNGLGFVRSSSKSSNSQSGYYNEHTSKSSVFILGFNAGYLVTEHLQVGLFSDLNLVSAFSNTTTKHFGIGPKINYYFKTKSDISPFVSVSGGYFLEENYWFTKKGYDWGLGAGLSYFLNKYIAIQGLLQYQKKHYEVSYPNLLDIIDDPAFDIKKNFFTSQLNFNFGFSVFF